MQSSRNPSMLGELDDLDTLSRGTRAYFQQRQRNRLYNLMMAKFRAAEENDGLTKAKLARRMGTSPSVISRMFRSPGNLRLDTMSDVLLAISGEELDATSSSPSKRAARNYNANLDIEHGPAPPSRPDARDLNERLARAVA